MMSIQERADEWMGLASKWRDMSTADKTVCGERGCIKFAISVLGSESSIQVMSAVCTALGCLSRDHEQNRELAMAYEDIT